MAMKLERRAQSSKKSLRKTTKVSRSSIKLSSRRETPRSRITNPVNIDIRDMAAESK